MASIGSNIRKLREDMGWSQQKLGDSIGKTRSAVSQYESGKIVPRMGTIEDLAAVFRVDKMEIIGERANPEAITPDELELIDCFRALSREDREHLMRYARAMRAES